MVNRRNLLKLGLASGATLLSGKVLAQDSCTLTPPQTEGPFYPINDQNDKDTDLTQVQGRNVKALGEVVLVRGAVQGNACKPIKGALVEIWQACASGRYNHPSDPNTSAPLDPNFQYWGRMVTDEKGQFSFKTIIPGAYPATSTWDRPPHIHFKVQLRGFHELTTQMYFAGHPLNSKDRIFNALSPAEQRNVAIDFQKKDGIKTGFFTINLKEI